ncbi:MAG TPA: Hsp20/alpha crystallin family protein [Solirubrobacterales bacterium]|nr:Hsp20/alpha crystallin family protein [Solirubrobacterales bacterium]
MASTITRWRPLADLSELRDRLDQVFAGSEEGWNPRIDVVKSEGEIVLRADLPGVTPDEINVEVEDGVLTVSGEHQEETEEKEERYLRRERRYGSFSRSMTLPEGVKAEEIEGNTVDGVLELRIPLPKAEQKPKQTVKVHPKKS